MAQQDFKPQGYLTLSNSGGIEIEINDSGDAVRYRTCNCNGCEVLYGNVSHWQEIKFDNDDEMYFFVYSTRYYLNQFMKYETT